MSLPTNNKGGAKSGSKTPKSGAAADSKFISKPKAGGAGKKPVKTGGSRGS